MKKKKNDGSFLPQLAAAYNIAKIVDIHSIRYIRIDFNSPAKMAKLAVAVKTFQGFERVEVQFQELKV